MNISKKRREREIFHKVYGDRHLADVTDNESPDFLVRLFANSAPFGVEVTEIYLSETDARLDRIPGYSAELLDGGEVRHKDDRAHITRIDILRADNSIFARDVVAIAQDLPPLDVFACQIAQQIAIKEQRLRRSASQMSHVNLIIQDNTRCLETIPVADVYHRLFTSQLANSVATATFREIYLVTSLDKKQRYIRLKMLHLLAEAYLFDGVIHEPEYARLPAELDDVELFAAYLNSVVEAEVLVHRTDAGTEVMFGDNGILVSPDGRLTVRLHSDHPFYPNAMSPQLHWEAILGAGFLDAMNAYRKTHTFRTEAVFPIAAYSWDGRGQQ